MRALVSAAQLCQQHNCAFRLIVRSCFRALKTQKTLVYVNENLSLCQSTRKCRKGMVWGQGPCFPCLTIRWMSVPLHAPAALIASSKRSSLMPLVNNRLSLARISVRTLNFLRESWGFQPHHADVEIANKIGRDRFPLQLSTEFFANNLQFDSI
jgi:hypothetical protein